MAPLPPHRRWLMRRSQPQDTGANKRRLHLHINLVNSRDGDVREYQFEFPSWSPFVGLALAMVASAIDVYREVVSANWLLALFGCFVTLGSAFWLIVLWRDMRRPSA